MKYFCFKFISLFCATILTSCNSTHSHILGSYEVVDGNNHALICADCGE